MCLILFGLDCHPEYKLVMAANRDEYYARPSRAAAFWPEEPNLLAGRDLSQNGTWMGITRSGRVSALTNFRNPALNWEDAPSRGALVRDYLTGGLTEEDYVRRTAGSGKVYNGYNLLLGTADRLFYHSNHMEETPVRVEPGIHGLSNSYLDVPWVKVRRGTEALTAVLSGGKVEAEALFGLLSDAAPVPDELLPHTGGSLEWERLLAPIFLKSPDYGTCVSTVLLIDRRNRATFRERSFTPGTGEKAGEVSYEFIIEDE